MNRPKYIDTVEKLISISGALHLESTNIFKTYKKVFLNKYIWYGAYETLFYNRGSDMFCTYDEEHDCFNDIEIEEAYEYAARELKGE